MIVIGFVLNFNLSDIISGYISTKISKLKSCPITYQHIDIGFFPPALKLASPVIHGNCFGRNADHLNLEQAKLRLATPSLYPPGLKFHTLITDKKSKLNIYSSISFSQNWIKIQDSTLETGSLAFLATQLPTINGTIAIDALFSLTRDSLTSAKVYLKSNNIHLPGQNLSGIHIPDMRIGNFSFKGSYGPSGTLVISDLIIGNPLSPLVAQISGEIDVNQKNFNYSKLNLTGEVKFSPQLLQSFSILNLFLGGKREKNGFYQLSIRGTVRSPSPSIL